MQHRVTPVEIYNKEFNTELRGYNRKEVNDFLDLVMHSYEEVLEENERLKKQIKRMKHGDKRGNPADDLSAVEEALEEVFVRLERIEKHVL